MTKRTEKLLDACLLDAAAHTLSAAAEQFSLSRNRLVATLGVARTIADLEKRDERNSYGQQPCVAGGQ